jgi:hypothetical protein
MRLILPAAALSATLACGGTEPSDQRVVGVILAGSGMASVINAPDTVRARERFGAVINTFGSSSCTTPDGVDLQQAASEVVVTPYDRVPADSAASCTRDMAPRPHPVQIRFTDPGLGRIVVRGRLINGTVPGPSLVSVTKTVVVLP